MSIEINQRLLFVGLGGTGINVSTELDIMLRKEMCGPDGTSLMKAHPTLDLKPFELPRNIQTVLIDTDSSEVKKHRTRLGVENDAVYYSTTTPITDMSVPNSYKVVASGLRAQMPESVKSWLPSQDQEPNVSPISAGAGQFPLVGRAALFESLKPNAEAFLSNFDEALDNISKSQKELDLLSGKNGPATELYIYVSFSIAGGTGTGIFYDILHLLDEKIRNKNLGLTTYMFPLVLMPQAFEEDQPADAYHYSKLNGGYAISDLAQLIDYTNAPSAAQEENFKQTYPGQLTIGVGGDKEKSPIPICFTFTKGPSAELDDVYKSIAAFCLSNIGGELKVEDSKKLSFFADLVNKDQRRDDDTRGPGLKPLVPAVASRLSIPIERISSLVSGYFITEAIEESKKAKTEKPEVRNENINAILKAARLDFVSLQNTLPENINLVSKPRTPSKSKDVVEIAERYLRAQKDLMPDIKKQIEYEVSTRLSSISVKKIIEEVLKQKSDINIFDAFNALVGQPGDTSGSALDKIKNFSEMNEPTDKLRLARGLNKKKFDRWVAVVDNHVQKELIPYYWSQALFSDVQFSLNLQAAWQDEIDEIRRTIGNWSDDHSSILLEAKAEIGNQGELVKEFLPNIGSLNKTWDSLKNAFNGTASLKDKNAVDQLSTVLKQFNNSWSSVWSKVDGEYSKFGEILIDMVNPSVSKMLSEGVNKAFDPDEKLSPVVPDLRTILEGAIDEENQNDIMKNSIAGLGSEIASMIAPGGLPSNEKYENETRVKEMVRVTYPAYTEDKDIQDWIKKKLTTGGALGTIQNDAGWEFTASKGDAIVITYVIMSQGILGNEESYECIKAAYESEINTPGIDKIMWRRRLGISSQNLIGSENDAMKVLTRLFLSVYLGKGSFRTDDDVVADSDFKKVTKFVYKDSESAEELAIPLSKSTVGNPLPTFMKDFLQFQLTASDDQITELKKMRGQGEIEIPEEIQNEKPEPSSHFTFITGTLMKKEIQSLNKKIEKFKEDKSIVKELKEYLNFWEEVLPKVLDRKISLTHEDLTINHILAKSQLND